MEDPENTNKKTGPNPGVVIRARNMAFDGLITGPIVDIVTENYSGKGTVSAYKTEKETTKQASWFERITNNQTFAIPAGTLILVLIIYLIYKYSGINLSKFI